MAKEPREATHILTDKIRWGVLSVFEKDVGRIIDAEDFKTDDLPLYSIEGEGRFVLRTQPQTVFRPVYLRCAGEHPTIQIEKFQIGTIECLMSSIPIACFADDDADYGFPLILPTCSPERVVRLGFFNPKKEGAFFQCWLEGFYVR